MRPKDQVKNETPTELGRFVVLRQVGAGGMGVVYVAYDPELDRRVAVKLLRPNVRESKREDARARLVREAKALARLSHPNVVGVYDVGTYHGQVFIAMEYIEGVALSQWLTTTKRSPSTVVECFIAAGRGLAAAHREGLAHGDFKPDNVIVDGDGRVRVVDFGLASAEHKQLPETPESRKSRVSSSRLASNDLSVRLTPDGDFAGTPAYLAPEQFEGAHRSARSDQFSFCVSLYEGLYAERPFAGETVKELRQAILLGPPPEPRDATVPTWLRRIVLRGLSGDPERRFPDMDTLLVALASDPNKRRWRIAAVVGVLMLLIVAAATYRWMLVSELEQRQGLCAGAAQELVGVWDPQRQQSAKQAFLNTGLPYAGDVWERVSSRLSARADTWVATHTEACRATHLSGGQSPALLDLRMACLQRRRTELRFLVDVFVDADAVVVENAVQAVEQLESLAACSDTVGLLAAKQPKRSPAERAAIAPIHEQLDRARAFERTARFKLGLDVANQAVVDATALADRALLAEAMLVKGELLDSLGQPEASQTLRQAFFTAEATGDPLLPPRLALALMQHRVVRRELERGQEWSLHARALIDRLGDSHPEQTKFFESEYTSTLGTLHTHAGRLDQAKATYRRALELYRDRSELRFANLYNNFGNLLVLTGELEQAGEMLAQSAELYRKFLGSRHPKVGIALSNLGVLMLRQGRFEQAHHKGQEALVILLAALGPSHPNVGVVENNLGDTAILLGDNSAAITHYKRARAIFETAFGADTPALAYPLTGLGEAKLNTGDIAAARELLEQALPLRDPGAKSELAHTRFVLARAVVDEQRERALKLAEEARKDYTEAGPAYARELDGVIAWLAAHPRQLPETID